MERTYIPCYLLLQMEASLLKSKTPFSKYIISWKHVSRHWSWNPIMSMYSFLRDTWCFFSHFGLGCCPLMSCFGKIGSKKTALWRWKPNCQGTWELQFCVNSLVGFGLGTICVFSSELTFGCLWLYQNSPASPPTSPFDAHGQRGT